MSYSRHVQFLPTIYPELFSSIELKYICSGPKPEHNEALGQLLELEPDRKFVIGAISSDTQAESMSSNKTFKLKWPGRARRFKLLMSFVTSYPIQSGEGFG